MAEKYIEIPVDFRGMDMDDYETLLFAVGSLELAQQAVFQTWGERAVAVWIMGWEPEE